MLAKKARISFCFPVHIFYWIIHWTGISEFAFIVHRNEYLILTYALWASLVSQLVKNPPAIWESGFDPWVQKIHWRREGLPTPIFWHGEFHGLYSPCGHKELDMTKQISL